MADADSALANSALDREALAYARGLLKAPIQRENLWGTLAAAAFAAVSALAFATAMVLAPPLTTSHLALEDAPAPAAAPGGEAN
ncbi:MAG: hypothetical protein KA105_03770 [Caulobacter sp.]|nr:hypothetical protein [Caulobacter sp.]